MTISLMKCPKCGYATTKNGLRNHKDRCPGSIEAREREEAAKMARRTVQCPDCHKRFRPKALSYHRRNSCPYIKFSEIARGSYGTPAGQTWRASIRELYELKTGSPLTLEQEKILAAAACPAVRDLYKWLRGLQINR